MRLIADFRSIAGSREKHESGAGFFWSGEPFYQH
jgi:hypothetical protein